MDRHNNELWYLNKKELIEKVSKQNTVIKHLEGLRREYEEILNKVGYEVQESMEKQEDFSSLEEFYVHYTTLKLDEKKLAFRYPSKHLYFLIAEAIEYGKTLDELLEM